MLETARSVNRTLSELRDAEAMIETFSNLRQHDPQLFGDTRSPACVEICRLASVTRRAPPMTTVRGAGSIASLGAFAERQNAGDRRTVALRPSLTPSEPCIGEDARR